MDIEVQVSLPLAFLAGLVSFLSPCILPVVPSYLAFVSGLTLAVIVWLAIWGPGMARLLCSMVGIISGFALAAFHGIIPEVPPENAKALVEMVHEMGSRQ